MQAFRSGLFNSVKNLTSSFNKTTSTPYLTPMLEQTRSNWGYKGRMMLKDIKRRELLKKFAPERIRLQTLRRNSILPPVLKVYLIKKKKALENSF